MFSFLRKSSGLVIGLLFPAAIIVAVWQQQAIHDWWRLRGYEPPLKVEQIAERTTMNDMGRKLFYVNRPELQDSAAFNETCHIGGYSIVLGCYISGRGIFIFDVQDERLQGIHEVTAAHEMLHAAYERLGTNEKQDIDNKLSAFFKGLDDARIKETIALYEEHDPGVVANELHSIIGTEVRNLTPELEAYYEKFFDDRLVIVGLAEQYEQEFVERKNKVKEYDTRLASLKQQIEALERGLSQQYQTIENEQRVLDELRQSEQYEEFNARIPEYNRAVREYNGDLARTRQLIEEYNGLVDERNEVASEEQELIEAIDSRRLPGAQ